MLIKDNIIINPQELITLIITINHRIFDILTKTRKRLDFLNRQESLREFYRGHFCQSPAPPTSFDFKPRSPNLDCIKFSKEIGEINRIVEL